MRSYPSHVTIEHEGRGDVEVLGVDDEAGRAAAGSCPP